MRASGLLHQPLAVLALTAVGITTLVMGGQDTGPRPDQGPVVATTFRAVPQAAPRADVPSATTSPPPTTSTSIQVPTAAAPSPPTSTAPPSTAPPPPPAPAPPVLPVDPTARVEAAFADAVPAAWRASVGVRFELIDGYTSWALSTGAMKISRYHATGDYTHLRVVLAHEFGHLIAFRWGTQAFLGAAPDGWPGLGPRPEESWADCTSQVFTGVTDPTPGLPACSGAALTWTADWLASGPSSHVATR